MQIFWTRLDKLKYNNFIKELIKFDKQNIVFTPNPEILLKTLKDKEFKNILEEANYLTPDWIGLFLAFQIQDNNFWSFINCLLFPYFLFNLFFRKNYLYHKYWDRICGSDLTKDLIKYAEINNIKISIIDLYNPNDSKKVASQKAFSKLLKKKFPDLKFDYFIYSQQEKQNIINTIQNSDSKMLFSTLWMKKQEKSVIEIMQKAKNIKIWLWIWSSFDYFIWFQKRAPSVWRKLWVEWLYRILTWPQKLKRLNRIYHAIFVFSFKVLKNKKPN